MLQRISRLLRPQLQKQPSLSVDTELLDLLGQLAADEGRLVEDLIAELLWSAVAERYAAAENFQPWQALTPREKQATALACLGYTNQEIAELMVISSNTVKTHIRNVRHKFGVGSKSELRRVLAGWDFAGWIDGQDLWPQPASTPSDSPSPEGIRP